MDADPKAPATCDVCGRPLVGVLVAWTASQKLVIACSREHLRKAIEKQQRLEAKEAFESAQSKRRGSRPRKPRGGGAGRRPPAQDLRSVLGDGDG